jgi:sulfur-carrier protein
MKIRILFFGVLAEVTGTSFSVYEGVSSFGNMKQRLIDEHPELLHYNYRIAVNNCLAGDEAVLHDNDEVALLPPFAGG